MCPGAGSRPADGLSNDPGQPGERQPFVGGLETELPWFIAATAQNLPKSPNLTPVAFMGAGALDEIRISSVRRDFAAL